MSDALRDWCDLADAIVAASPPRETVHHIVEANLGASNQILAALGAEGYEYDWGWLFPDDAWTARLGYAQVDAQLALALLRARTAYVAALLARDAALLSRTIRLRDSADGAPYTITVEGILRREVEHAREHLG